MKQIRIAASPINGDVFAGHLSKCGTYWLSNKRDVTGEACAAVAMHVIGKGGEVVVTANGKPKYEITVKEL